jgi:tetratricopeptide (TPR) repeat protein
MPIEEFIHPFPGLRPFAPTEHDLFFGREGQSEEILGQLREHRLVAVVGASGSGKSSLIRAGLLPYLHSGFLTGASAHWCSAIFRPGGDPIKNLATALNDRAVLGGPVEGVDAVTRGALLLEVSLRRSGLGLVEAVRLARLPPNHHVLIVVDQFEELFRFAGAPDRPGRDEDAAAFVKLLLEASRQRELPIYVVLTMRSDYIGDCARYSGLPEAVTDGLYLIPRMTREQRRAAIVEPVRVSGGSIAPRLVVRLLNDVGDDPDQLPILQHALMRTWEHWKAQGNHERPIDVDDYLAIGGMADALSQHADEAYDGLPNDRYRAIAKRTFQALSEKGIDNRATRRPTTVDMLAQVVDVPISDIIRVIEDFRAPGRSFLMPPQGVALEAGAFVDISHESLIRGWRRMRQWVEDEAESARVYRRLADTASLHTHGIAGLLRDPDLEHVLSWHDKEHPNAAWGSRYYPGFEQAMSFLQQSRIARDDEQQQRDWARRRMQVVGLAVTILITIVALVALWEWHEANNESQSALLQRDRAEGLVILLLDTAEDLRLHGHQGEAKQLSDQAISNLTRAIDRGTNNANAFALRGLAYTTTGDYDHALADYRKATDLDPQSALTHYGRARTSFIKQDYDTAVDEFTNAINSNFNLSRAYSWRGFSYWMKDDLDLAQKDFQKAIELDATDVRGQLGLGLTHAARGEYDDAIAKYEAAIALDPLVSFAHDFRGLAHQHKGDLNDAIADYNKAIEVNSADQLALFYRSLAYYYAGSFDTALEDLNKSTKLNPTYAYTAMWLHILKKRRNLPSGLAKAETQIDMSKWPAQIIRLFLGQMTQENIRAAAVTKRKVCDTDFYTAELALLEGKREVAAGLFQSAAADCPKDKVESLAASAELRALGIQP